MARRNVHAFAEPRGGVWRVVRSSRDALAPVQRCASGVSGCAARGFPPKQCIGREVVSAIGSQDSVPRMHEKRRNGICVALGGYSETGKVTGSVLYRSLYILLDPFPSRSY